jgi:hypothetical protein
VEHLTYSLDLAPNDFWLFPKIKSASKGRIVRILKTSKKCDESTESYFTTGVPKKLTTVAASLG